MELLIDKYYFKDEKIQFADDVQKNNFYKIIEAYEKDSASTSPEELVKIAATIYRSIQRHTTGDREYLQFVQLFIGTRTASGAR